MLPVDPSNPENAARQAKIDAAWYIQELHAPTFRRYLDFIAS